MPLATLYAHGFLIDVIYVVVVAAVIYFPIALLARREDLARTLTGLVVVLGLLLALVDNLH